LGDATGAMDVTTQDAHPNTDTSFSIMFARSIMTLATRMRASAAVAIVALAVGAAEARAADPLLSGPLAAGGTWTLSASKTTIGSVKGLCLTLSAALPDGFGPSGGGCVAGSLRAAHGVWLVSVRSSAGAADSTSLAAGVVTGRARSVRLTFADGRHLRLKTQAGPKPWRHELGQTVRYFAADVLPTTAAVLRSATAYDAHHHRIGATSQVH
jgi:hypothetical protein